MKRLVLIGCICSLAILSGFTACGKQAVPGDCDPDNLTTEPQACPDRASLGFAQEFGSGTYINTSAQESLSVRNLGTSDLVVDSATFTGDSAFKVNTNPATFPANIKGNKELFVQVFFAPTQAKLYTGKLVLQTNAANDGGYFEFPISGCGVPSDGGASPCYRDGGTGP